MVGSSGKGDTSGGGAVESLGGTAKETLDTNNVTVPTPALGPALMSKSRR